MRLRLSIRNRVALLSALTTGVVLAAAATAVYLLLRGTLVEQADEALSDRAADLIDELGDDLGAPEDLRDELADESPGPAQVVRDDGTVLVATGGLSQIASALPQRHLATVRDELEARATVEQGRRYRVVARRFEGTDLLVIVAEDMEAVIGARSALLSTLVPVAAGAALLTGIAAAVVAGRGLRPLRTMATSARAIDAGALDGRLPVPSSDDEVAALAGTVNAMLDRLADAIARERAFTADASHELRTPLAILRGEIEVVRAKAYGVAAQRLDSALEEADRLVGLIDDLLLIARADADQITHTADIALDHTVRAVAGRFAVLARQRGVTIDHTGQASVRGDPRAIERAIANLVDNAVRHTPTGGTVDVTVAQTDGRAARVVVADTGPGVDPALLHRLFDRFSRTDDARTGGGAGLGLAIVAAVAQSHHGSVACRNRPEGGLEVRMDLVGPDGAVADGRQ